MVIQYNNYLIEYIADNASEKLLKFVKCKTVNTQKNKIPLKMIRAGTDAIDITPSQFILENQGVLGGAYVLSQKIGQGS